MEWLDHKIGTCSVLITVSGAAVSIPLVFICIVVGLVVVVFLITGAAIILILEVLTFPVLAPVWLIIDAVLLLVTVVGCCACICCVLVLVAATVVYAGVSLWAIVYAMNTTS